MVTAQRRRTGGSAGARSKPRWLVLVFLPAALALIVGVLSGLARVGVGVPDVAGRQAGWHGALMLSAFFGTLISLERAVALGRGFFYAAPTLAGLSGLTLLLGYPLAAAGFALAAAAVMTAASLHVFRRQPALFTAILGIASACWLAGAFVWFVGGHAQAALSWWLAFVTLTIAGERLELSRLRPKPRWAQGIFAALTGLLLGAALLTLLRPAVGSILFSAALLGLALWLSAFDLARHTIRQSGVTRFIAVCLLSGYVWLALAGALGLGGALLPGHPWRDAALHALALGFVFSMVFGHAPIILPALSGVRIPYHPALYLAPLALQLTLALRLLAALLDAWPLRQLASVGNALALALFAALMVWRLAAGLRRPRP